MTALAIVGIGLLAYNSTNYVRIRLSGRPVDTISLAIMAIETLAGYVCVAVVIADALMN